SLLVLCRFVHDAGAMRDAARSNGNQQFDRQGVNRNVPTTALPSSFGLSSKVSFEIMIRFLHTIGSIIRENFNLHFAPGCEIRSRIPRSVFKGFHFEHLRAPNTPKRPMHIYEDHVIIFYRTRFLSFHFLCDFCILSKIYLINFLTENPASPFVRGGYFTTFGRAINRRAWSDLCIDIGTLKYTNVPLIGLSPPVRTIKAAFHTAPKSLLTGTPFKSKI
ncbi:hypothetical protein ALC60_00904, partial [Trachymyrmex zeteki]